jgi:hypothetical protein
MKAKMIAAVILVLGMAAILYAQSLQKQTPSGSTQRFQLFAAETEEQAEQNRAEVVSQHSVFLLDTETGKVWRYQSPLTMQIQGKPVAVPATFFPVRQTNPE